MSIEHLTKEQFGKILPGFLNQPDYKNAGKPVLIDFYASWCGPCKAIAPVLEELKGKYEGMVGIYKVDVDEESELANDLKIRSVPTLMFFPAGRPYFVKVGASNKSSLEKIIEAELLA